MGNMVLHMREYRNKEINNCPINLIHWPKCYVNHCNKDIQTSIWYNAQYLCDIVMGICGSCSSDFDYKFVHMEGNLHHNTADKS